MGLLLEAERCIPLFPAGRRFLDRVLEEYLFICIKATHRDDGTEDSWDSFTGSIKKELNLVKKELQNELKWGALVPYNITGQLNQHPRSAIAMVEGDEQHDYVEFYDKLVADL